MGEMEGQIYDHSHEGEMIDTRNVNESQEIVKMRRDFIVRLIDNGEITNPEAAIIIVEKLQRQRSEMERTYQEKAEHETPKEIFKTARNYTEHNATYQRYLVGTPPSPVRYCIEEAQERIREGFLRDGYDLIKQDDELFEDSQETKEFIEGTQRFDPDLADELKEQLEHGRKYGVRRLEAAARRYQAAANWYTMAAKLERRQEETSVTPKPPQSEH